MSEPVTTPAKHIFLDVVGFTRDRSVEAQVDVVGSLNRIVRDSLAALGLTADKLILLPTGDGICIVLLAVIEPYDAHISLGLAILEMLDQHNSNTVDPKRRFELRIGINENVDNLVTDVNGSRNIAGAGINTAQRVMNFADGNQIFVGATVHETLRHRERYLGAFRPFTSSIKHGFSMTAYQYIGGPHGGLNTDIPIAFAPEPVDRKQTRGLPRIVAYYLAHALKQRGLLLSNNTGTGSYTGIALLWFWAEDSLEAEEVSPYESPIIMAPGGGSLSPEDQFTSLSKAHTWLRSRFARYIENIELAEHGDCFESAGKYGRDYRFVSVEGIARLRNEHPDIWKRFQLDEC